MLAVGSRAAIALQPENPAPRAGPALILFTEHAVGGGGRDDTGLQVLDPVAPEPREDDLGVRVTLL